MKPFVALACEAGVGLRQIKHATECIRASTTCASRVAVFLVRLAGARAIMEVEVS